MTQLSGQKKCRRCEKEKEINDFPNEKRNRDGKGSWCKPCLRKYNAIKQREEYRKNPKTRERIGRKNFKNHRENPEKFILNRCKYRAKKNGIEFNLKLEDIKIPTHCPLLGIKIEMSLEYVGKGRAIDSSPSVDRVDPQKGYVRGNIRIISFLANMIKSKATPEQIKKLARNIDKYVSINSF